MLSDIFDLLPRSLKLEIAFRFQKLKPPENLTLISDSNLSEWDLHFWEVLKKSIGYFYIRNGLAEKNVVAPLRTNVLWRV